MRYRAPDVAALLLTTAALLAAVPATGAQELRLGIAAPLSGPRAVLGRQLERGARSVADATGAVVEVADSACSAEGGAGAAERFVAARVDAVVGFLCTAEIEASLPILSEAGIATVAVGVRANRLTDDRERTGHLVWRLAPRSDAEADALADFVRTTWRDVPFGIVEDGSTYARDLADEVRARLGPDFIEPSLVDNYRPAEDRQFSLARRIEASGVTRLLVFGTAADTAIIARDATELGLELDIVGGEALADAPAGETALPAGIRAIAIPAEVLADETGEPPREGYAAPAQAAAEIALAALSQARATGQDLAQILSTAEFATILGPLRFDASGESDRAAFGTLLWDGARFVPAPER